MNILLDAWWDGQRERVCVGGGSEWQESGAERSLSGGTDLPNGPAAALWNGERYRAWERKGGRAWLGMRCHMEPEGESDSRKGTLMASVF